MMLAAFAVVSMSAFAQGQKWQDRDKAECDDAGKTQYGMERFVKWQCNNLMGPDNYTFETMLDRLPASEENALVKGIYCAHRQAILEREHIVATRFPDLGEIELSSDSGGAMASVETGNRPMRMVMESPAPRDIDYRTAFDILTSSVNATESTWIGYWWKGATYTQKDVVVRLLKRSAAKADEPIYASLYINNLDWVTTTGS